MTNKEFEQLTRQAWKQYPVITEEVRLELLETYLEASELVKTEVLRAERVGLSSLTIDSKNAINQQLDRGVSLLTTATEKAVGDAIIKTIGIEEFITDSWLAAAAKDAGLKPFNMSGLNTAVREKVLELTISRQFQDGYTLADRVWESASLYKTDMSRIINLGLAQGKDNIKIAQTLSTYIKGGRSAIKRAGAYGKITRGNGALYSRISQNVDWRALRLIRSEEQLSLQEAQKLRGQNNPGCTGMYKWIKNSLTVHECTCQFLANGSPYKFENIPSFPHPNCLCTIEQILRKREDFVNDLIFWSNGGSVPYMDNWYNNKYLLTN
jgi:hypothetical protein